MSGVRRRALALSIDRGGEHRRTALRARLNTLLTVLGTAVPADAATVDLLRGVESVLASGEIDRTWLALAVLTGRLPDDPTVERRARAVRLDGPLAALGHTLLHRGEGVVVWPSVRVVSGQVLVDVQDFDENYLSPRLAPIWNREHRPVFVGWTESRDALRPLSSAERSRLLGDAEVVTGEVLVPWRCTYLLPEPTTDPTRARPLLAMLRRSGTKGVLIGSGCLPLSSAEAVPAAVSGGFATMLAAAAWADKIAATSEAAAAEYGGWRAMLAGTGLAGPDVQVVPVADEPAAGSRRPDLDELPSVLCVGNSASGVLAAAELLWQEGLSFSIALAQADARCAAEVARLQGHGRPLRVLSPDLVGAAYAAARCTVFPFAHDELALPVAASLAAGTPVICAGYGSMREVAATGGALFVDPRDDDDLADAMRRLLTDDVLHSHLTTQARARSFRTWEQYAKQVWDYLVATP